MSQIPTDSTQNCKSCGTPLLGAYCHVCGEKLLTPEDKSVKMWLGELLSSIWMLDGKLINTLRLLILRPGRLASDFVAGKRKPYVRPLNIFLIANILYFISPVFDTFKTTLHSQMYNVPHSPMVQWVINAKVERDNLNMEEYSAKYDQKTSEVSKLILIVLAPLMGFLLFVLFRRQGLYLSDGFALGLQYWAFFMLIFMVVLPNLNKLMASYLNISVFTGEVIVSLSALFLSGFYLFFQMKPWKGTHWHWYIIKIALLIVAFLPLLWIYRFLLFWATYLAL